MSFVKMAGTSESSARRTPNTSAVYANLSDKPEGSLLELIQELVFCVEKGKSSGPRVAGAKVTFERRNRSGRNIQCCSNLRVLVHWLQMVHMAIAQR
jgi:hypothetical protein